MECMELKMFLLCVKMIITSEIHRHGGKDVVGLTEGGFDYDRCMLRSWPMRASVKKKANSGGYYEWMGSKVGKYENKQKRNKHKKQYKNK